MVFRKNRQQHILAIIVGIAVAAPIICLPIGVRKGISPNLIVKKAYEAIWGKSEELYGGEEIIIEDWALEGEGDLIEVEDGEMIDSTYTDGELAELSYTDVPKYTVYQAYDEYSNLPIELLDPQYFAADDTQYYVKATNSILKQTPRMDSLTLTRLAYGVGVTRIGVGDTWSKIRTQDGEEGYVLTGSITDEMVWQAIDRSVWVDTDSLIVRSEPSTQSEMITTLHDEDKIRCIGIADKWYKIQLASGQVGYVYKSFTTTNPPPTPTPTPTPRPTTPPRSNGGGGRGNGGGGGGSYGNTNTLPHITGKNGESIVSIAASLLGVKYVFAGESRRGVDCSGLVKYCYAQIGIYVPHGANMICNQSGVSVSRSSIQLGDVVCYDYGGRCGHVAIYAGGGKVIHASMSKGRVIYGNVDMLPIRRIKRIIR